MSSAPRRSIAKENLRAAETPDVRVPQLQRLPVMDVRAVRPDAFVTGWGGPGRGSRVAAAESRHGLPRSKGSVGV